MIDTNQKKSNSVVYEHSQTGYFLSSDIALQYSLLGDHCWGKNELSTLLVYYTERKFCIFPKTV